LAETSTEIPCGATAVSAGSLADPDSTLLRAHASAREFAEFSKHFRNGFPRRAIMPLRFDDQLSDEALSGSGRVDIRNILDLVFSESMISIG
jgi:hypothetical protein